MAIGCSGGAPRVATAGPSLQRLIYAAQDDGTIHVYDLDHGHRPVRTIPVFDCCADVRGMAAAAATHRLYVMYNRDGAGHVAALDLLRQTVLWDKVEHSPGVDRGNLTPDGRRLYLPTWESDPNTPYELVIDALSGAGVARVPLPARSHDTIVSLDGRRVFMETKSPTGSLYIADTTTNRVVATIGGYCCSKVLAPFAINGKATLVADDVEGYYGFQVADVAAGRVVESVPFSGMTGAPGHGIAWTPDERQVWASDGSHALVHVFDMTATPPRQVTTVSVGAVGPHWITFSLDGRFAYVAGRKGTADPTDVIDARTYQTVARLGASEDLLEIDLRGGKVVAAGNQFGVGRVQS